MLPHLSVFITCCVRQVEVPGQGRVEAGARNCDTSLCLGPGPEEDLQRPGRLRQPPGRRHSGKTVVSLQLSLTSFETIQLYFVSIAGLPERRSQHGDRLLSLASQATSLVISVLLLSLEK